MYQPFTCYAQRNTDRTGDICCTDSISYNNDSNIYSESDNESVTSHTFYGRDSVLIDYEAIKQANIKMIEGRYYKDLSDRQTNIISLKDEQIRIFQSAVERYKGESYYFQERAITLENKNDKLNKRTKRLTGSTVGLAALVIIVFLL